MNMIEVKLTTVSPAALAAILSTADLHELLDVRTPPEYASAHVPGARLMPLNELNVEAVLARHESGSPIYVLCQAGERARTAIERFQRAGCDDCVLVEGGTQGWIDAGLPVHRGSSRVLPIMRQVQIVVGSLSAIGAALALTVNPWFAILPLFSAADSSSPASPAHAEWLCCSPGCPGTAGEKIASMAALRSKT